MLVNLDNVLRRNTMIDVDGYVIIGYIEEPSCHIEGIWGVFETEKEANEKARKMWKRNVDTLDTIVDFDEWNGKYWFRDKVENDEHDNYLVVENIREWIW